MQGLLPVTANTASSNVSAPAFSLEVATENETTPVTGCAFTLAFRKMSPVQRLARGNSSTETPESGARFVPCASAVGTRNFTPLMGFVGETRVYAYGSCNVNPCG